MTIPTKTVVIGLDALTPRLVSKWVDEGRLPNIARFAAEGAWGTLNSVPNRNSAAAWSSMITGLNPGKHGIFWFTEEIPEDYTYRFINASHRHGKTMWRVLSDEGKRVIVINVPLTFPAEEVNGITVAGLDAPTIDHPRFTHPPGYRDELVRSAGGEYTIHSGHALFSDRTRADEAIERLHKAIDARAAAGIHALENNDWDFFMLVFMESDVIQHFFFQQMESPRDDDAPHHQTAIRDVYEHLDRVVGDILERLDDQTLVVLVSDHGARADDGLARALPDWLEQLGYLKYRSKGHTSLTRPFQSLLRLAYRQVDKRLSTDAKHRLSDRFPALRQKVEVGISYGAVDWGETLAYTDGKRPEIWVNLKGRQSQGTVTPERHEEIKESVATALTSPVCASSGKPVVTAVHKREDAYTGSFVNRSPDLVIQWAEEDTCLSLRYPDGRRLNVSKKHLGDDPEGDALNGGHAQHGVIGFLGAGAGKAALTADILDVAPTVLFSLGAPIASDIDGRVLLEALDPELAAQKIRMGPPSAGDDDSDGTGYSEDEEQEIRERLSALGYVE